jgi:hypothetical protein
MLCQRVNNIDRERKLFTFCNDRIQSKAECWSVYKSFATIFPLLLGTFILVRGNPGTWYHMLLFCNFEQTEKTRGMILIRIIST